MTMTTKRLAFALSLALLAALLAGCMHANVYLKLNADGSAEYSMDMMLSDTITDLAKAQGQDPFAQTSRELEAKGFTVTPRQEEGYTGISFTKHYADVTMIGTDEGLDQVSAMAGGIGEDFSVKADKGFFSTKYTVSASMDTSGLLGSQQELGEIASQMADQVKLTMNITLPARAASHNAAKVSADGLTYTWEMKLNEPGKIDLVVAVPNMGNILIVGGGALVVILIVVVIVVAAGRRKSAAAAQRVRGRAR